MCGIFGVIAGTECRASSDVLTRIVDGLLKGSESRGKESSGIAILSGGSIGVYKRPIPASRLVRDPAFRKLLDKSFSHVSGSGRQTEALGLIGHARLVTNGGAESNDNNQPILADGIVGVHNGIVVNDEDIWRRFPALQRRCTVDTEAILALMRMFLTRGADTAEAAQETFSVVQGSASIASFFDDRDHVLLATNTGSLYFVCGEDDPILLFASEADILRRVAKGVLPRDLLGGNAIRQILPGEGCLVSLGDLDIRTFGLFEKGCVACSTDVCLHNKRAVVDLSPTDVTSGAASTIGTATISGTEWMGADSLRMLDEYARSLKRCSKCILPETMPFISFDSDGVCNYCRDYVLLSHGGAAALEQYVGQYRSQNNKPDCLVAFSGGRDSSYGLHYVKKVLGMHPVAFTYDWGVITDLGRRNQARMCGKLGVEQVLVSADIKVKRENIRKNIQAWLRKPDLGMVPIFMAGDKQFFYLANKVADRFGVRLIIWSENPLEKTSFKSGFCGIRPSSREKSAFMIPLADRAQLAAYYVSRFLANSSYLNSSLVDTLTAYVSYYFMHRSSYLYLYRYLPWDEEQINRTLRDEYDWELATDTNSTWRIGDGTAPFYNFIYYTLAGFTENDTFRSNQIREGLMTRERALQLVAEENRLRVDSFRWYCDTVGIDPQSTIERIISLARSRQLL